ncbi:unnamed protein product, partial [Callosobruchus maculatus]
MLSIICKPCNASFKSSHSSTHLSIFDNPDICKYCDRSFRDQLILDNHIMKKHPEFKASIRSKLYECSYCTYKTTVKRYLKSHMPIHS